MLDLCARSVSCVIALCVVVLDEHENETITSKSGDDAINDELDTVTLYKKS